MSGRLEGKIAIVTGGARGIGEGITRRFAAEGARVVIVDQREDLASALIAELGDTVSFVAADVTSEEDWTRATQAAQDLGGLDILVNNVGGAMGPRLFEDGDIDYHRRVMDLNLTSAWIGMRAAIPLMRARGGGSIVNISSIDGLVGMIMLASYTAAKFALTGATRTVALEVGKDNIRVNAVHPGNTATPLLLAMPPDKLKFVEDVTRTQPISRFGRPDEIAGAVLFFASDDSTFCTGSSLLVDGGKLAGIS